MKNRLILLALGLLCYGHVQADNFNPDSYIASPTQAPQCARKIATLERIYEDKFYDLQRWYEYALFSQWYKEFKEGLSRTSEEADLRKRINSLENKKWYYDKIPFIGQDKWNATQDAAQLNYLLNDKKSLSPLRQSNFNNMASWNWASRDFEEKLKEERAKSRPSYEYFQHPSRNILSEY